ncbi:flavonoid 3'-monooxygenase CYP75B137-like [Impatiens glandulifera]|uniref:flavonoid 3'-monooxygenase CYP75B137-like n=1 Tax=Impatiens glandulifera TaxID=253017 RepID=UPI001FB06B21|nr:flavonoid 3'-monooxygenase CYP75B137-like [Impatiens glandulifera]
MALPYLQTIVLSIDESFWFLISILALSLSIYVFTKRLKTGQSLPIPPGPKGLPLLGNLLSLEPEIHTHFATLAKTYGPIFTLKLGLKLCVVITSPSLAREILKDQDTIFANRDIPAVALAMPYGGKDIVFTPYGPEWRMLRRVCVHDMLGTSTLDSVYPIRFQEMRNTVKHLYGKAGCSVNIGEMMFLMVINVVTNMLWGSSVSASERASIGSEFRKVVEEITQQIGKPNVSDFIPWLAWFDLQGVCKKMRKSGMKFDRIFNDVIDKSRRLGMNELDGDEDGGIKDFLQVLLKLKDEKNAKISLTMNHIKALLLDMVVGGTDTTSNTIEFAMAEMMNKPEIIKKVQEELDNVVGKNKMVQECHIPNLPYLTSVMKEVLRLHPALPLMVPHCPSDSRVIGETYTIPKSARVFINVWAIHRDPLLWENPLEFNPDRFVEGRGDYSGKDFSYIPFGSGRRSCAGIVMAERMTMFSLASLLHSFDWKLPEGEKLNIEEKFGIVLKKRTPLIAVPTPRLSNSALYELSNI